MRIPVSPHFEGEGDGVNTRMIPRLSHGAVAPTLPPAPETELCAVGFSRWKRGPLRQCFPGRRLSFVDDLRAVPAAATPVVWGMAGPTGSDAPRGVIRVEDGFLRSVGLGADLVRPVSWVLDRQGIYFDATRPSGLENILAHDEFPPELLARAAALRARIVAARLTKYNVGTGLWQRPSAGRIVLVPGQVESDASIVHGAPGIRTNLALLQAARAAAPDAYLVYKPHPDVVAGLRARGAAEDQARQWCDEIVADAPMAPLIEQVDAVHTLTSLAGFEALLRGKPVTCHGQPFYAGWGLTDDRQPVARRTRRLTLDQLVAGALIKYPTYLGPRGSLIDAEAALDELIAWRDDRRRAQPWWRPLARAALRQIVGVR